LPDAPSSPIDLASLRAAGPAWLSQAFGVEVSAITELSEFVGGRTGRKARLSVEFADTSCELPGQLFVKFSRDLDDEVRDRGRNQMESEVQFALLSRMPDFPVAVPRCLFADYDSGSGSGVLITERISFGTDGIEEHHAKARDYEVPELLEHYDALIRAMARLAGSHRAGLIEWESVPAKASGGARTPATPDDIRMRVDRYADFAERFPQLLPESLRTEDFITTLRELAPLSIERADALRAAVKADAAELTAFCHWNANIDNAWFWRGSDGELQCGLMDWGNVGQINLITALSSGLIFTEPDFLVAQLDHFLALFARVFEESGGGFLDAAMLRASSPCTSCQAG
jgi:hypothetical protein